MKRFVYPALWAMAGALAMFLVYVSGLLGGHAHEDEHKHEPHKEEAGHKEAEGEVELSPEAIQAAGIEFAKVEKRPLEGNLLLPGTITANQDRLAHVTPRIRGRVEKIGGFAGQDVKRGDQLAALDSVDLGIARAAFMKARAARDATKTNFQREDRLLKKEATTEPEFLNAKSAYETAEAEFKASRETLLLYGLKASEIDALAWDRDEPIGYFPIVAPFDGTIIEKHITIGEVVDTGNNLFTIADLSTVWLILELPQKELAKVRVGQSVEGRVQGSGERIEGKVTYVSDTLRTETRSIEVRIEVANPARRVKPGMFVSATLVTSEGPAALTVPAGAVQRLEEASVVFSRSKKEANHFQKIPVTVGRRIGDRYVVISGLKEGDEVVSAGSFILKSELLRAEMGHDHSD